MLAVGVLPSYSYDDRAEFCGRAGAGDRGKKMLPPRFAWSAKAVSRNTSDFYFFDFVLNFRLAMGGLEKEGGGPKKKRLKVSMDAEVS